MAIATQQQSLARGEGATLADLLERVLDKGIVIAGDVKLFLGRVELLTLQIRLVICSVDKAKEIGLDWWTNDPAFGPHKPKGDIEAPAATRIEERLDRLEQALRASGSAKEEPGRAPQSG